MRQLDLFGFDSEPQPVAPSQKKKTVTVVPAPTPAPASAPDSNTLVFADDKIGIKIKLKREISVVDDTTPNASVPKMGDDAAELETESAGSSLQQLTLEDAIREVNNETKDAQQETANLLDTTDVVTENQELNSPDAGHNIDQQNDRGDIATEETLEISPVDEVKQVNDAQEEILPVAEDATTDIKVDTSGANAPLTPEPTLIEEPVEMEGEAPQEETQIAETSVAEATAEAIHEEIADAGIDVTEHPHSLKLVKPAVITIEEEVQKEIKPVVLSRPFLARPSVIEINNDTTEETPEQELTKQASHQKEEVITQAIEDDSREEEQHGITEASVAEANEAAAITPDNTEVAANENSAVASEEEVITTVEEVSSEDHRTSTEDPAEENQANDAGTTIESETAAEAKDTAEPQNSNDEAAPAKENTETSQQKVSESIAAGAAAEPLVAAATETPVAEQVESFSAIVEEAAAKQQQPAKIKAPKLQSSKEPVAPKKRGRKSFKEIDAESDLIQLPDDEALFEKQYYPISVVAGWFNVNASLLRFWENEFDILKPRKNRKGDRLFRPEDVKNLQVIYYLLRQRKFTIEGAKEYLKTNKKKADTNTQLIQSLNKLRGFLLEFKANIQA